MINSSDALEERIRKLECQIQRMRDCRNCKFINKFHSLSEINENCRKCEPSELSEWKWEGA